MKAFIYSVLSLFKFDSLNIIEIVIGAAFTLLIIYCLRTRLSIDFLELKKDTIKIPVSNITALNFAANNLIIEATYIFNDMKTCHLQSDLSNFIILPGKKNGDNLRVFQAFDINPATKILFPKSCGSFDAITKNLKNGDGKMRIRVHASHEFTGFGRAFEAYFKYDPGNKSFERIKN